MSFLKSSNPNEETQITLQTLNDFNKPKQRKVFCRQPADSHSNDSRRSVNRSKLSLLPSSYIKLGRQSEPIDYCQTERGDYSRGSLGRDHEKASNTPRREISRKGYSNTTLVPKVDPSNRRLQHLEQQLSIKNRELELITEDRQSLKRECKELQQKYENLARIWKSEGSEIERLRQDVKRLTVEKRKLESERGSLNKKIEFLEKFNFSPETKTLQSLRESHLEKQVQMLKEKLKSDSNSNHSILEDEIAFQKEQIFSSRKLIESLQISNACLQKKLDENNCYIHQEEDYSSLRNKYKKFLIEYKELRKSFENVQKENQVLRSKQMINSCSEDFSLELSLFSALNN